MTVVKRRRILVLTKPVTITLAPREDGGLRVYSDDVPGLILSGEDPHKVMADVIQALSAIAQHKYRSPR